MVTVAKICVIIPAYNEAGTVGDVIKRVHKHLPEADIVVINDGSQDATQEVARAAGATVLDLPFNLGIGGAVQTGLKYAWRGGYDMAIEIDADGQHDPAEAPRLVQALITEKADLVIGSRFTENRSYRSSVLRRFGIHTFSALIRLVTRVRIYDSTSGFRVYGQKTLKYLSARYPLDFPEPESIVLLLLAGFKIHEVGVVMQERQQGESVVRDFSLKAIYFVVSNSIAILVTGLRIRLRHVVELSR